MKQITSEIDVSAATKSQFVSLITKMKTVHASLGVQTSNLISEAASSMLKGYPEQHTSSILKAWIGGMDEQAESSTAIISAANAVSIFQLSDWSICIHFQSVLAHPVVMRDLSCILELA